MSRDSRERLAKPMAKLHRVIDAIEHTPTRRKLDELHTQMLAVIASAPMTYDEDQELERHTGDASMSRSTLPSWAEVAFDSIDASFFSGDVFHNAAAIETAEFYIGRWTREIARIKETLAAEGADNDPA